MKASMNMCLALLLVTLSTAFGAMAGDVSRPEIARPGNNFSFADGQGSLSMKQTVGCGPASPYGQLYPGQGPTGPMTIDLSLGVLPAGARLGDTERAFGSWRVQSLAATLYDGAVTQGTISPSKGGAAVYELYGFTNFTGSACNGGGRTAPPADYATRNPVRIIGLCGNDQEIVFEISRRPLATDKNGFTAFPEGDVIVRGSFRGNVTCGQTTDRNRVRVNLTFRR